VTLLKAAGPSESADPVDFSEETLREVAQFAVSYSSDWKDGRGAGDAYMVEPDQVSKTPESGEYIEKGSFVIRGDRTYFEDVPCRIAVGVQCEPVTQAIGGPPSAIVDRVATSVTLEPGMYAQNDAAMMVYRELRGALRRPIVRSEGGERRPAAGVHSGGRLRHRGLRGRLKPSLPAESAILSSLDDGVRP